MAKKEPRSATVKLLKAELKIDTAKITEEDKAKGVTHVADVKLEGVVKVAKERMENLSSRDLKGSVKVVLGTLNSFNGVLVEGKKPKELSKEIDEGKDSGTHAPLYLLLISSGVKIGILQSNIAVNVPGPFGIIDLSLIGNKKITSS
ncbi:MAG: hypothetical protein HYT70_01155 [Candidatus Aenigmarchaeota archaeon]|nr:hypothetical protein [Candidatus Aenigmarchaeota archaeon]